MATVPFSHFLDKMTSGFLVGSKNIGGTDESFEKYSGSKNKQSKFLHKRGGIIGCDKHLVYSKQ